MSEQTNWMKDQILAIWRSLTLWGLGTCVPCLLDNRALCKLWAILFCTINNAFPPSTSYRTRRLRLVQCLVHTTRVHGPCSREHVPCIRVVCAELKLPLERVRVGYMLRQLCISVRLSVIFVHCVETAEQIEQILEPRLHLVSVTLRYMTWPGSHYSLKTSTQSVASSRCEARHDNPGLLQILTPYCFVFVAKY